MQSSRLNDCFHENSENKAANVFHLSSLVFTVSMAISVWTHNNYDDYKMKIWALLISFKSGTAYEKKKLKLKKGMEYS